MRIYLGTDHAGFELKEALVDHLTEQGHDPVDCGAHAYDPQDDYPSFCIDAAERCVADPGSLAVVIGGSGNGEQIAANKVLGARTALAWNEQTATLARQHNDANVISLGARENSEADAMKFVDLFVATPFSGEARHQRRIDEVAAYERKRAEPAS